MTRIALVLTFVAVAGTASAEGLPSQVTLPAGLTVPAVDVENFGQAVIKLSESDEVTVAGKHWYVRLDVSPLGDDQKAWTAIVGALKKSGWTIVFGAPQFNPPYASLKLIKNGKETWFDIWVAGDNTNVNVVDKGGPAIKLALTAPTDGIAKVGANDDFPFLKKYPGSKLTKTEADDRPFTVQLDKDKDGVAVTSGSVHKEYELPANTGRVETVVVYRDALKTAGWTIVEQNTSASTNDPNLTAHYTKAAIDLWVHVHGGETLTLVVGDAGTERGSTALKTALDKTCKVAIYGVNFDFDKATLRADATPALDSIYKLLADYKDLKVELGGHTDNVGERAYNQKLSESRVATVKAWLAKKGIAAERLTTKGYADTVPVVPNDTSEHMAKNRRVELRNLDCKK